MAIMSKSNHLGNHRIIVRRNFCPGIKVGIDSHPQVSDREVQVVDSADRRHEIFSRIFSVDAAFDRAAQQFDVLLPERKRFSRSNPDLCLDKINACHHFGYGMFNLNSGIHFHKIESVILVHQKLDRSGIPVVDRIDRTNRNLAKLFSLLGRNERTWTFFNHLLFVSLNRTVAFREIHGMTEFVSEDLDFDMLDVFHDFFKIHPGIAECAQSFTPCLFISIRKLFFIIDPSDSLAAATGRCFQQNRVPDFFGDFSGFFNVVDKAFAPRNNGNAALLHLDSGIGLVPHQ